MRLWMTAYTDGNTPSGPFDYKQITENPNIKSTPI